MTLEVKHTEEQSTAEPNPTAGQGIHKLEPGAGGYDKNQFSMQDLEAQNPFYHLPVIWNKMPGPIRTFLTVKEFSSYCPATGHPDYATIELDYLVEPGKCAVEQKALRDWLNNFRTIDLYQEEISFGIKWMIHKVTDAKWEDINLKVNWSGRGGISNIVCC